MEPLSSPSFILPISKERRLAERRGIPKLQLRPSSAHSNAAQTRSCHSASVPGAHNSASPPVHFFTPPPSSSHRTLSLPSTRSPGALSSDSRPRLASLTERKSAELLSELAAAPVQAQRRHHLEPLKTPVDPDRETKIQSLAETLRASGVGQQVDCYRDSSTYYNLPPTPTKQFYDNYFYPVDASGEAQECDFDIDAFSSDPPTPISPSIAESVSAGRSRASTLLSKVIPHRLRAGIKRRISAVSTHSDQPPTTPSVALMPNMANHYRLHTPPDEDFDKVFGLTTSANPVSSSSTINETCENSPELSPILPQSARLGSSDSDLPRKKFFPDPSTMDVYWEESGPAINTDWIASPLHPPTISPSHSPHLDSNATFSANLTRDLKSNLPIIYPTSPALPRRPTTPVDNVTANSLADMIEAARKEDEAYEATYRRMLEGGWSSEQELQNVRVQRHEAKSAWDHKIGHAKKLLEVIKRSEVVNSSQYQYNQLTMSSPPQRANLRRSISAKSYLTIRPNIMHHVRAHSRAEQSSVSR